MCTKQKFFGSRGPKLGCCHTKFCYIASWYSMSWELDEEYDGQLFLKFVFKFSNLMSEFSNLMFEFSNYGFMGVSEQGI